MLFLPGLSWLGSGPEQIEIYQSTVGTELAGAGGVEVDDECRPGDKVGCSQGWAVVDAAEVGWCAAIGGRVCKTRQAPSFEVERERVD